jgi:hypothetical protein
MGIKISTAVLSASESIQQFEQMIMLAINGTDVERTALGLINAKTTLHQLKMSGWKSKQLLVNQHATHTTDTHPRDKNEKTTYFKFFLPSVNAAPTQGLNELQIAVTSAKLAIIAPIYFNLPKPTTNRASNRYSKINKKWIRQKHRIILNTDPSL